MVGLPMPCYAPFWFLFVTSMDHSSWTSEIGAL
jgi:hypothetical protein